MKKILFIIAFASSLVTAQNVNIQPNGTWASVKDLPQYRNTKHKNVGNGNGNLGDSYYKSLVGLNYVEASELTETRTASYGFNIAYGLPASLSITGLPTSATIDTAFVYFAASYTEATPPVCSITITNPASVVNTYPCVNIGSGGPVCWGETGTATYRIGVSPAISGNGTYSVNISGFTNPNWEVDGVTLLIVYTDPALTDTGTIVIADGDLPYTNSSFNYVLSGFTACHSGSSKGNAFVLAGDIQSNVQTFATFAMNGGSKDYPSGFWDFDTLGTSIASGQNTVAYSNNITADCYVICMAGVYFQKCVSSNTSGCPSITSPPICYVTSDTTSQHDEVFWQKSSLDTLAIDSFVIYRGVTSSLYVQVGRVAASAYSSFIDTSSNPNVTSYFYELGVIDTCHTIHTPSAYNQSVFLQSSLALGNKVNLNWNQYAGEPVNYYRILRDDSGTGHWHVLDSVPGLNTAYTDVSPPLNPGLRYMINTIWNISCVPTPRVLPKRTHGRYILPFIDESYSNNVNSSSTTGIQPYNILDGIEVYPNPVNNILSINLHMPIDGTISITNLLGQQIYSENISVASSTTEQIDMSLYTNGVYFLSVQSQGQRLIKKVVKL